MRHTKEPWEVDHRECDGVRYFVMLGPDGKTIMDTMNSESQEIHEDFDEDGFRDQWDQQGREDLTRAAKCVNVLACYANPEVLADVLEKIGVAIADAESVEDRPLTSFDAHILWADLMEVKETIAKLKGGA